MDTVLCVWFLGAFSAENPVFGSSFERHVSRLLATNKREHLEGRALAATAARGLIVCAAGCRTRGLRARAQGEAVRRANKLARKRAQREGLIPGPKPKARRVGQR